jgi:hypothetical protein
MVRESNYVWDKIQYKVISSRVHSIHAFEVKMDYNFDIK